MRAPQQLLIGALFAVGFLLLGLLHGARVFQAEYRAAARMDRLLVAAPSRMPLPLAYKDQIAALPNVAAVTAQTLLGGDIGEPPVRQFIVLSDAGLFSFYDEFDVSPEDLAALASAPNGLIVMRALADLRGWEVGDAVVLKTQAVRTDGSADWEFRVVAITDRKDVANSDRTAVGNYTYVNETRTTGKDGASRFMVRVRDAGQARETARAIDALFQATPAPTRTLVEGIAVQEGQLGRAPFPINTSVAAVAFVIFNLAVSLGSKSLRGYTGPLQAGVAFQLVRETVLQAAAGAAIGLTLARVAIPPLKRISTTNLYLSSYSWDDVAVGVASAALMAAIATAFPIWRRRLDERRA